MKRILALLCPLSFFCHSAFAYLPVSDLTTMSLPVYGIYMTTDPTCTTGLVATITLSKTAKTINFAANAAIGSGAVPATVGCVVIVTGNDLTTTWKAGTYTTTTQENSDSVCDAGGSTTGQTICNNGTPTWPTQITTDAAAIGLTLKTTTCSGSTSTDVVPLVLSTNSVCTGQSAIDDTVAACENVNLNNFSLPTSSADASHGTKLTAPSTAGDLKFIVNPTNTLGSNGSSCGNLAAPLFSFAAYTP